jgi:5-formyltetrahydrofolate cyclo-ligase
MKAKVSLRQRLLALRAALTASEIQQKSTAIAARVCAMPAFSASQTIMAYLALPQEVQTVRLIEEARRRDKRVAVPVVQGATLIAVALPPEKSQLQRGPYGILEPCDKTAIVHPDEIDYVFVPGLAFDRRGGRLGFGMGYYDSFLRQLPTTHYCGLAFSIQIVPCVPRLPHDVCMPCVVTEQEIISCTDNSGLDQADTPG